MGDLVTYLINLDGSTDRLAQARASLGAAGIGFERRSAVDGRGSPPEACAEYDGRQARRFYGRPLTGGEIGCWLSHIDCARAFLASGAAFGLVLEDDVAATPASGRGLEALLDWAGEHDRWHMANLGRAARHLCRDVAMLGSDHVLVRAFMPPTTTTAILWSRAGAAAFLHDYGTICAPLDHFLRRWLARSGMGLAMRPPLFAPSGAPSVLDAAGGTAPARRQSAKTMSYHLREFRRQALNYGFAGRRMLTGR